MSIPFVRSGAPFDDLCIHVRSRGARDAPSSPDARGRLARWLGRRHPPQARDPWVRRAFEELLGERAHANELCVGGRTDVRIYTARIPVAREKGRVAYLEGMAHHRDRPLPEGERRERFLLTRPRLDPGDASLRGHFTGVVGDEDRLTIFTDWLGMSQLYRADLGGEQIISNRMHLLRRVVELRRSGPPLVPEVLAQSLLMDTTLGCETLLEGVRLVPLGSHLTIDAQSVHERRHTDLLRATRDGTADDYADLLEDAEHEIRENWRAIRDGSENKHRILYLTGGIDSRVALAAAVAEDVPGLSYYTYGPPGSDDRRLAAALAEQVGMPRFEDGEPSLAGPLDSATRWASLNYGQRTSALTPPRPPKDDRVRIRGATGETFRGYYSTMALARGCDQDQVVDDAFLTDQLLSRNVPWNLVPKPLAKLTEQRLRTVMANEPLLHETPCSVDALYPLYRNRHHFGLGLRSGSFEAPQLTPLYSPSAVMASLLCDRMARLQGKVAYDLIRMLAPALLATETTSGPWHPSATNAWPDLRAENPPRVRFSAPAEPSPGKPALTTNGLPIGEYRARLWRELPEVRDRIRDERGRVGHLVKVERFATLCDHAVEGRRVKLARKCLNKGLLLLDVVGR